MSVNMSVYSVPNKTTHETHRDQTLHKVVYGTGEGHCQQSKLFSDIGKVIAKMYKIK